MNEKEINITIPEGYEIDKEKSSFEKIVFKKVAPTRWRDNEDAKVKGFFIGTESSIQKYFGSNIPNNHNVFSAEKQAKSALAMARISQIMENDERFGGVITDEEWEDPKLLKHIIERRKCKIFTESYYGAYQFLAFHTRERRDLFLEENEDLVKDYLMLD